MFKIITSYWHYENNNISAYLDLIIEDKILLHNEDISLTKSIPNLILTLTSDYHNSSPIFICACGNINCNFATYDIEHKNKFIVISNFRKISDVTFSNLTFTIEKKEYIEEIVNLIEEFIHFEETLSKVDENYKVIDIKNELKNVIVQLKDLSKEEYYDKLNLREVLERVDVKKIINIINQFPWKVDELINYLYDNDEKIRYKSAEILGVLQDTQSLPIMIERLSYEENQAVIVSLIKALSNMGYLRAYELMDKLYKKRKQTYYCKRDIHRLDDKILTLLVLLKEVDKSNKLLIIKALNRLNIKKDDRVYDTLSDIITDCRYDKELRLTCIELILKVDINRGISLLVELLINKQEDKDIRYKIIRTIGEQNNIEVIDALERISVDKEDELSDVAAELLRKKYIRSWF